MTPTLTLLRQGNQLADPREQVRILAERNAHPTFADHLSANQLPVLQAESVSILQINLGKLCNQTCTHCHVDAGPDRREIMTRETLEECLAAIRSGVIKTVDLTGGAPEMNPHFRWFVEQVRALDVHVIDRCNLTILLAKGYEDLPEFLSSNKVEIVASLPCYLEENTDRQRGDGVYAKSIAALKGLNQLGYGMPDSSLKLSLVFNPGGTSLPPDQSELEAAYRTELRARHNIEFTQLFTITNMPISRFLDDLLQQNKLDEYLQKLTDSFNPAAVAGVMCRETLSVDWRGNLYDCDFNQMLELPVSTNGRHIRDFARDPLSSREIVTGRHCFGCTAGAGSSCQGAVV